MKITLIILLLFASSSVFTQEINIHTLEAKSFANETKGIITLPVQYKQEYIQARKKFLRQMYSDTTLGFNAMGMKASDFYKSFDSTIFVYDFDFDGKYDYLFYGYRSKGYENTNAIIFYKRSHDYEIQHLGTALLSLNYNLKSCSITSIHECCAENNFAVMSYEKKKSEPGILLQTSNQLSGYSTDSPNLKEIDTSFVSDKEFELVIDPEITGKDMEMARRNGYYAFGTILPGTNVKSYDSVHINGKTWLYVVADTKQNFQPNQIITDAAFYGEITTARGWIRID